MTDKKCIAPWIHLHTWPNGNVYPCCLTGMTDVVGNLHNKSLEEIWNDEPMRKLRRDFINGVEPTSCSRCFEQERNGQGSQRDLFNRNFPNHKDLIATTNPDGSLDSMQLAYWDFRFSNICNFRCRSCGPQLSSGWYEDTKKIYGSLPNDIPDPKKTLDLWEQLEPYFETVEEIYFAGGEPLLMREHYLILERLDSMGRHDVRLRYNTNFSTTSYKRIDAFDVWSRFKDIEIGASIDGMQAQGEFIRKGMDWSQTLRNRERLRQQVPHARFFINCTTGVQNAYHVVDFYRWCVANEFIDPDAFRINLIQFPLEQRIQVLPVHHKHSLETLYNDTIAYANSIGAVRVQDQWRALSSYMWEQDGSDQLENLRSKMNTLDEIRNESFAATFPELQDLVQ